MVYEQRASVDYKFGQLTAGITSLDTTLTSADFASLASDLSTTKYVPITIADDAARLYETAWITGHSAGSSAVTVVRGREGSTARAWATGSAWRCAPTVRDTLAAYTRATLPADAHLGMRAMLTDEAGRVVTKTEAGWLAQVAPFGHLGATDGFQAIAAGGNGAYVAFSAAQELIGGMTFNNASDALVVPIAGRYQITTKLYATGSNAYQVLGGAIINDGAIPPAAASQVGTIAFWKPDANDYAAVGVSTRRLAAGDLLRLWMAFVNAASTFGSTGYNGSYLEALYLGP